MKHGMVVIGFMYFILSAAVAMAAPGELGDNGGANAHKHNFSKNATHSGPKAADNGTQDSTRICIFCHTPHGASAESTLWNRKDPGTADADFSLYGNASGTSFLQDPSVQDLAQYGTNYGVYPNGASRLCMSCHDGVNAIGDVLNVGDSDMVTGIEAAGSGKATKIIDLAVSHPISFVYNSAVEAQLDSLGAPFETYLWPPDKAKAPLDGKERMQCTTCHDPHTDTILSTDSNKPMWRYLGGIDDNANYSDVCTACHEGGNWDDYDNTSPKTHNIIP